MNRSRVGKWARWAVWGSLLAVLSIGCNPLSIIGFIFAKKDPIPAQYPLTFDKDGPKKDKDEIVVAFLPQTAPGSGPQFATTANDLADKLARQFPEMAKGNQDKKKIKVINQTQVNQFKTKNQNWKQMGAGEIGQKLGADFVLEIWLDKMRLYDPRSDRNIYEGRAEVFVSIYEIDAEGGKLKDKYPLSFSYPRTGMRSSEALSESAFKGQFIENLALEIAKMHVDHVPSDSIADGH